MKLNEGVSVGGCSAASKRISNLDLKVCPHRCFHLFGLIKLLLRCSKTDQTYISHMR